MPLCRILLVCLGLPLMTQFAGPARAAPAADPASARKLYLFNIPAQSLPTALVAYVNVVGKQIIYDSRLTRNRRSGAVVGLFTADAALRLLLEGTDLTIVSTGTPDIMLASLAEIRAAAVEGGDGDGTTLVLDTLQIDMPPGAERRPDFADYGHLVQAEIKRALTRSPETARRIYEVRIELWVDAQGRVQRPHLVRSSGKADLDAAIQRVLLAIILKRPPPEGMPQPIRVAILGI